MEQISVTQLLMWSVNQSIQCVWTEINVLSFDRHYLQEAHGWSQYTSLSMRSLWVQLSRPKNEFEEPKILHIGNPKKNNGTVWNKNWGNVSQYKNILTISKILLRVVTKFNGMFREEIYQGWMDLETVIE